eukprot:TRINITY_DN7424_c0_g1_i1.p1 TRINITY_DN7424_c0_g1~~TRINITY_DN7424_c0_g1_i1.p1  ORF type:complete len:561 (-),score=121.20 TRINITY_DN7424_c0_g1_i1:27-1709(-)
MTQEFGKTRDHLREFKLRRDKVVSAKDKELEKLLNQFKILSVNVNSANDDNQGWMNWRKTRGPINPITDSDEDLVTATNCSLCKKPLGKFFGKPRQCPLCARVVDANCIVNKLPTETRAQQVPVDVNVCDYCFSAVTDAKEKKSKKEKMGKIEKLPFVIYHKLLSQLRSAILEDQPRLKNLMLEIGDEHNEYNANNVKKARAVASDLEALYKNFESTMKTFEELKPSNNKEAKLQSMIKMAFLTFIQDNLAEFRVLNKQIRNVESQPIKKGGEPKIVTTPVGAKKNLEFITPVINFINPVMLPLSGGSVVLSGDNFSPRIQVHFDNVPVLCKYVDSKEIIVTAPALVSGFKTIRVTNPDGTDFVMEQILCYSSEMDESVSSRDLDLNNEWMEPEVESVEPVACSLKGIAVTIRGSNFVPGKTTIKVGGKFVQNVRCESTKISFMAPSMTTEGFKDIQVTNPDGKNCVLENILLYSNSFGVPDSKPPLTTATKPAPKGKWETIQRSSISKDSPPTTTKRLTPDQSLFAKPSNQSTRGSIGSQEEQSPSLLSSPRRIWGKKT